MGADPLRPTASHRPRRRELLGDVAAVIVVGVLLVALWPTRFGGATSFVVVHGASMEPHYSSGDLVVVRAADGYRVGDVVVYRVPAEAADDLAAGHLVIHRIVGLGGDGYELRGDNRTSNDPWTPDAADIVGRVALHLPSPGQWIWTLIPWALCALIGIGVAWSLWPRGGDERDDERNDERPDDDQCDDRRGDARDGAQPTAITLTRTTCEPGDAFELVAERGDEMAHHAPPRTVDA